jgi:hypothetical protein
MNKKEKILALQLILEDIRGNWGWNLSERVSDALDLANELSVEDSRFAEMVESIKEYKSDCANGDNDGRYFRNSFPYGYEGMDKLHNLTKTYHDKSSEFKADVSSLTYPENRFVDWKEE